MKSLPFQDMESQPVRAVDEISEVNTSEYDNPLQLPELRYTNMSTIIMEPQCRRHIVKQSERFEQSARFLGKACTSDSQIQSAQAVQQTVAEIDQIMLDAERAIQNKLSQLRVQVDEFAKVVRESSDCHWYRNLEDVTGKLLATVKTTAIALTFQSIQL